MRTIGYICDNVPLELIEAAGFRAHRVSARPVATTALVDRHVKPELPFRAARPSLTESILDAILGGRVGPLDHLVIPRGSDPVTEMYVELLLAKRRSPDLPIPTLHFLDRNVWPSEEARAFNGRAIERLRAQLETWAGGSIDAEKLRETIGRHNARRARMRAVTDERARTDRDVAGSAALAAYAMETPRLPDSPAGAHRLRLFLGGSEVGDASIYRWLEDHGATVVAEDHGLGQRLGEADADADEEGCPFAAIAARFDKMPGWSASMPLAERARQTVRRATTAHADAAILYVHRHDRLAAWDAPTLKDALAEAGIPTLLINEASGDPDLDAESGAAIESFLRENRR